MAYVTPSNATTAAPLVPGMSEATTLSQLAKAVSYWQTVLTTLDQTVQATAYNAVNQAISDLQSQQTHVAAG